MKTTEKAMLEVTHARFYRRRSDGQPQVVVTARCPTEHTLHEAQVINGTAETVEVQCLTCKTRYKVSPASFQAAKDQARLAAHSWNQEREDAGEEEEEGGE